MNSNREARERLRLNWTWLVENMDHNVVEVLFEQGIMEMTDRERIMGERSRPDKVIKCLEILMAKPDEKAWYPSLLTALEHRDFSQPEIKKRLEGTKVPEECTRDAAFDQEQLLEQILKDSLTLAPKGEECSVDRILKVVRVQLRRQQRSLEVRTAEVLSIIRKAFPQMVVRKNKKKNPVAVKNCAIKPETLQGVDDADDAPTDDGCDEERPASPISMSKVTARQVADVMRLQLEKDGLDVNLASRMEEAEIDGAALVKLTESHIEQLFKDLKMGKRIRLMDAVQKAIAELQKPPEISVKHKTKEPKPRQRLETYRAFDTRPRATDVYDKGHVLPEEQSRPGGQLLEPLHKYSLVSAGDFDSLATEAVRFAAACMNERVNGTIHFGVVSKYVVSRTSSSTAPQPGEIVGLPLHKEQCEVAITEEIFRAFYNDQREMALKCIRDPVYIPVRGQAEAAGPELYVVEVDVVPKSSVVGNQAFFLKAASGKNTTLLRYVDGGPREMSGKDQEMFQDNKKKLTELRSECEKDTRAQPAPAPNLHRKLHGLLTYGNDIEVTDIFPVLVLSPFDGGMPSPSLLENFCCLKSLEPVSVFDFNPPSASAMGQSHCLHSLMENQLGQVYQALTTDNFDKESTENREEKDGLGKLLESIAESSFRPWIFCNGYGPLEKEELKPVAWRNKRGQGFKEAVRFYREQIPADKARIIILLLSKNYEVLLAALEEIIVRFPDQWILVAESEKIALDLKAELVRGHYVEKEDLEERSVIGMPWSHFTESIKSIFGYSLGTGCTLPTSSGKDSVCVMRERERNGLPDLEILSKFQCYEEEFVKRGIDKELDKKKRTTEEEFYRGKQVSWWNFFFQDHVLKRDKFDSLLDKVKEKLDGKIPDDEKVAVVSLYHQPGAGGTTTARQLLWELKGEYRCCAVKQIPDPRQTCDQITTLRNFEEPESPKPPLVLIDNEDEEKVFQLCSYMNEKARREARDSRGKQKIFCVLVICIRMTVLPKKKDDKVGLMLGHELQHQERMWFRTKYETLEERFKKNKLGLHPKLLISFNIIKENFDKDYIKRTVNEFINQIKEDKEKRLLKYIALVNSFDPDFQSIPLSCFNVIMTPPRASRKPKLEARLKVMSGDTHWEATLSTEFNVLLNRTPKLCLGSDIKAVRIINNNLSREILENLCRRDNQKISDVILEFLHTDTFKRCSESSVQRQLIKIMKDVLKKRAPQKKGRYKFSPIIMEIGKTEDWDTAAEVLKVGFDRFDDAMIAQQIARVYIHCCNWKCADEYARIAQDIKPKNSYLCDTHGQVFKEQLIERWKDCLESEDMLEGNSAKDMIDTAFNAIEIFRREQKLSDDDCTTGYNNCGFFSELRVMVTLLDCCRFLKSFKCDKGEMLHRFLVDDTFIPEGLREELDDERIEKLKRLYHEYEKPMRRLEDEQIQLKEDSCYQYSPCYSNSVRDRRMFVHLQECLDTYFGEDKDEIPKDLSKEAACEYRRRRVKRKGGNSLRSIYGLRDEEDAVKELGTLYAIIRQNVVSSCCNTFDLKTILNITMARMSKSKRSAADIPLKDVLHWTQTLYEKSKQDPLNLPYLEAYLYLVMFNWPTEWRLQQALDMYPCSKVIEVIKEWKAAFQNIHPAQRESEGKQPDRRKGTTLFFLGEGEGFDEIVFYSELQGGNRRHIGDDIWDTHFAQTRLKQLRGTLMHGGSEMSVKITTKAGSSIQLSIPTSYPIKDHSLWQKSVRFVLGFCWSGPKAFSVNRDDQSLDLKHVHTPLSFEASKRRYGNLQQKQMTEQAVENFWKNYFYNQVQLELVAKDLDFCVDKKRRKDLEKRKKALEKEKLELVQKRTSVLQGPD